jgi:hypothetical protein
MPILSPEKCYTQQPKRLAITVPTQEGFFKKPNPLPMQLVQLVQLIVYGNLRKSEALLQAAQANPSLLETLLTEKVTVIDYSRRKVKQKTAFQAALCAMDDELCAMLAKYMPKEEMARQYQEIFPEGHDAYYQKQTPIDFSQIVEAISQSSNADVQKAISLELPNPTVLWSGLEQFRADFTQRSSQETVFNPQHLLKAFELYVSQFDMWSCEQRDLFWRQVVGFVQRFLPANIAMDFAQNLLIREWHGRRARSFSCPFGSDAIFPPSFDSFSGLGYEFGPWFHNLYGHRVAGQLFSDRMSSKNNDLGRIMQFESSRSNPGYCIIL